MPAEGKPDFRNDWERKRSDEQYVLKISLQQIVSEKETLNKKQKSILMSTIYQAVAFAAILLVLNALMVEEAVLTNIIVVVEMATLVLVCILLAQFNSLRGEIAGILGNLERSSTYHFLSNKERFLKTKPNPEVMNKVFDVRKNSVDKLFAKLGTFSNTWLVVTGGVTSSLIVEIFKSNNVQLVPSLVIVVSALLLWDIAQNLYGILNYELVKKTKDLAYWWLTLI